MTDAQPWPNQTRPDQPDPDQTCDRCGPAVRAAYRVQRQGELYLCKHCANRLWPDLSRRGWNIWPVGEATSGRGASHDKPLSWLTSREIVGAVQPGQSVTAPYWGNKM